jgi:TPR repeat protein
MPEVNPDGASVRYYRDWAERGDSEAQYNLGLIFDTSFTPIPGALQDDVEAANWYHRAAEKGHARAQYKLGLCCTDQRPGEVILRHRHSCEANVLRSPKLQHAV